MSEICPYPDHGSTPCGRCSGCCGAEEYCCATPEIALEAWKRDAMKAEAEVDRLQSQLEEICDTIRYHLPAEVPEGNDMCALVEATAHLSTERDIQTGRVMIENGRLRTALAIFADEGNWSEDYGVSVEWDGESNKPWLLAQKALAGEERKGP